RYSRRIIRFDLTKNCILGLVATVAIIFIGVLAFLLYHRVKQIINSAKATAESVKGISSSISEAVSRPPDHWTYLN
ncbi:hypothetical protein ACFLTP_09220, partial [Chloroflexota bacterium]